MEAMMIIPNLNNSNKFHPVPLQWKPVVATPDQGELPSNESFWTVSANTVAALG